MAHRGASAYCPENTIRAIEEAIRMGADMVEVDLQASRDGNIVVFHDETVDRVTNGHGYVRDMTLRELKTLDVCDSEKIPVLDEVIEAVKNRAGLMLDVTESALGNQERSVIEIVHQYRIDDDVLFCGAHTPLNVIKRLDPSLKIAPTFREAQPEDLLKAVAMKASVFNVYYESLTPLIVRKAHEWNLKVTAWVVNSVSDMHELIRMGVDGITTDYPDILGRTLRTIG